MLDFSEKTYKKILDLAVKYNIVANCREYPSLVLNRETVGFDRVRKSLKEKFSNPNFICGLYVNFPFCKSRCTFCKYYSELFKDKSIFNRFLDTLEKELELYQVDFSKRELDNLFFGGGTPTLLTEQQMERYLGIIYRFFRFKKNAQISIEGTPESINEKKIKQYRKLGINRISIGLQSSNDDVLKRIGRLHKAKDVFKAFEAVHKGGIKYIGTEIIWALPGESWRTYNKTLRDIIKLSPDFVEGYFYTTGGLAKVERFYPLDVDLDEVINLFKEKLLSNGYRIGFSGNFLGLVKKGVSRETAVNRNTDALYGYYANVMGIGPGASSHYPDHKYKIVSNFTRYADSLEKGEFPALYGIDKSDDDYKRHYIILQIGFYRSLNKKRYYQLFGRDFDKDFPQEVSYLKKKAIIKETPTQYKWYLDESEMGHKSFFIHVVKYWHNPQYVQWLVERYLNDT